jgi:hypothetical protein
MLVAVMVGYLAAGLVFAWLMIHRFRLAWLEQQADRVDLDAALAERRAEAQTRPGATAPPQEAAEEAADPIAPPAPDEAPSAAGDAAPTEVTTR